MTPLELSTLVNEEVSQPQMAIAPFIIWGLVALVTAVTITIIIVNSSPSTPVEGTHLELLGMKHSGKTTFLNWLRYRCFMQTSETSIEKYEQFTFNGITIAKGVDIGGDDGYIRTHYHDKISQGDVVVLVFNASLFLSNYSHRQEVLDRAYFIWGKVKNNSTPNKKYAIIATHFDKTDFDDVNKCRDKIISLCSTDVKDYFSRNLTVCDLTKKDSVNDVVKRIFNTTI